MTESISTPVAVYAALVMFAAYFVRGLTGFGSSLVAVPLLAFVWPVSFVVPVVVLLDYVAALVQGVGGFRHIRWRELAPLLPFILLGVLVALHLLTTLQPGLLTAALGVFVITYGVYALLPLPRRPGSRWWAVPLGALAGLVGTVFAAGGPFTVIYLNLRQLDKDAFRGTVATIFALDGSMRLVGFTATGLLARENLWVAVAALPCLAAGLVLGGRVHTGLSQRVFVRTISVVLLGSGVGLLAKSFL